ncbi:MAG: SRPBCC family protein [Myxococcota bacterium]
MSRLDALVDGFDPTIPVERATTPPSSWYTDPDLFALERRAVFARAWHPAARLSLLDTPGAYVSGCHVGEPWVVVRDASGSLGAFSNTCRHKGREVVTGTGQADRLVCGYHAWSYGLDGRLKSAPKMAGIEAFDREALSLPPLGLDAWGPWAFINHRRDAPPMAQRVASLDAALQRTEWQRLRFIDRKAWTIECNWKVYVDNYLDGGYHIPHMHPSLDAQLDMASYRTELFGEFSIQSSDAAGEADARTAVDASVRIGDGAIYAWVYPNFMLNRYGPCLDSNLVIPLGPDRCRVEYEFYFLDTDGPEAQAFVRESIEQADVTQREDIAICESVQRGLHSQHYDRGRYAPRVELGEHHFHSLLAADLRRAIE